MSSYLFHYNSDNTLPVDDKIEVARECISKQNNEGRTGRLERHFTVKDDGN